MNRWIKNGAILLLALLIPVAGFFSLDALYALFPDEKGQITVVEDTAATPLLYVDESTSLTFYPWTLYNEKETVSLTSLWGDPPSDPPTPDEMWSDQYAGWMDLYSRASRACSSSGYGVSNLSVELLASQMRYQPSVDKYFLSRHSYTSIPENGYYLELVWNGTDFEHMHHIAAVPADALSNDERIQCMNRLEQSIQAERQKFSEIYDPTSSEETIGLTLLHSPIAGRLREFFVMYGNVNYWDDPYLGETVLPTLLYYGNYHMVFYEGEILLFFMPQEIAEGPLEIDDMEAEGFTGNTTTGLLLYVDPQTLWFNGFSVLDLTA